MSFSSPFAVDPAGKRPFTFTRHPGTRHSYRVYRQLLVRYHISPMRRGCAPRVSLLGGWEAVKRNLGSGQSGSRDCRTRAVVPWCFRYMSRNPTSAILKATIASIASRSINGTRLRYRRLPDARRSGVCCVQQKQKGIPTQVVALTSDRLRDRIQQHTASKTLRRRK